MKGGILKKQSMKVQNGESWGWKGLNGEDVEEEMSPPDLAHRAEPYRITLYHEVIKRLLILKGLNESTLHK